MIRHNIKQSIRGMLRTKVYSSLNITGFAVGFAVCIIIMIFAYKEYSVDTSFANSEHIYRLIDTEEQRVSIDDVVVSKLQQFSGVQLAVPILYANWSDDSQEFLLDIETGNNIETSSFIGTNNDFFELFGLKILTSKAEKPFADNKSIVLTESIAMKLFGKIDVLDKIIKKDGTLFTVSAVAQDMPQNSSITTDVFINDKNPDYVLGFRNTAKGTFYARDIYLLLNKKVDVAEFTTALNMNFPENKGGTKIVSLQPLTDIYMSQVLKEDFNKRGNKALIYVFLAIALLTLAMSIFNYANFMISTQMATLKNSGIRITNGAMRSQIRSYYFTEVFIAIVVAFALALFIAQLAMPYAERLLDTNLGLSWLAEPRLLGIVVALFFTVVFLSAISPILFISRLKVQTLFGKTNIKSRKHPIRKVMNVTQLTISMVLLVAVFTINKQLKYVKTTDVGFNTEHLLRLNIPWDYEKYDVLKNEFSKLPFVTNLSLSSHTPGAGWSKWGMKNKEGKQMMINVIRIDRDFLKTFGLELQKGREFRDADINKAYYFTDYTQKAMGWENLEDITLKDKEQTVIGVVNDVYYNSLHSKMLPVAFFYSDRYFGGLNLKLATGKLSEQMTSIKETWKKNLGAEPFSFNFYDQYFDSLYKKEDRQAKTLTLFSLIAFIITCLGLLAQIMQVTQNRIKEIGIRKINGATIKEVMILLNKDFIWNVVIAFVIATPIAYYAMNKWLESFAYKTSLSWWIFALAGLSALAIALLTVSWQSWRTARRNPVEALRYE